MIFCCALGAVFYFLGRKYRRNTVGEEELLLQRKKEWI